MQLQIHHRTEYLYSGPVSESNNEIRLRPLDTRWQICESCFITILPATRLQSYEDLSLNRVNYFYLAEPHDRLVIESRSTVTTKCRYDPQNLPSGGAYKDLARCKSIEDCHPYLQHSELVEITPEAWRQALDIKGDKEDVLAISLAIMESIYREFTYLAGVTNANTHATTVLQTKQGVCQDFSHAMVAMCRAIGIPARYVSGYFYDPTRDHSLRGSGASHAWVQVYVEPIGWLALDPTNNKIVDETYVILAVGRDYHDVAPVRGSYYGGETKSLTVMVQVDRL